MIARSHKAFSLSALDVAAPFQKLRYAPDAPLRFVPLDYAPPEYVGHARIKLPDIEEEFLIPHDALKTMNIANIE